MKIPATGELHGRAIPEWIGKTPNTPVPPDVQLRVLLRQSRICPLAKRKIRPSEETHCDHKLSLKDGGENRETNLQIVLAKYHRAKTAAENSERAEVKTLTKKAYGIKPKTRNPLPGSKASGWKKNWDGSWVRRTVPVVGKLS